MAIALLSKPRYLLKFRSEGRLQFTEQFGVSHTANQQVTLQKDVTAKPRGGDEKVASNLPRKRLSEDMMKDQVVESIAMPERKGPLEILPHADHATRLFH